MIAINIRGTGGSGKSTLVKRVMERYPFSQKYEEGGRKRPLFTEHWVDHVGEGKQLLDARAPLQLRVLGHYETACGGCDTIKTVDRVYQLIRIGLNQSQNVLYEGIMVMDDVTRAVALDQELKRRGGRLVVVSLTTSIEDCLAGIRARKAERGDTKPLNEKNTRERMKRQENSLHRLRQAGVELVKLERDEAYMKVCELLGVSP